MVAKRFTSVALSLAFLMGAAIPGVFADEDSSGTDQPEVNSAVDLVCVQTAVDKREDAVAAGFTVYSGSIVAAQAHRKADLHAAWAVTDAQERKHAIKAAWKTFKDSVREARKALRKANKDAWSSFRTERKLCGGGSSDGEGGSGGEVQ